ncbi:hypothetical protein HDU96_010362 [Phlyctochytrium bullatum]|nr:hypothetical protein HDU96_010362 [Phlyctochytrium bullatum]
MDDNGKRILEQVFANLGLIFWSFQLLPQVIQNHRDRSTGTLSPLMMLLWALWTPVFAAGTIRSGLTPALTVQPNLFGFFAAVCWVQIWYWAVPGGRGMWKGVAAGAASVAALGVVEVAVVFLLRALDSSENQNARNFSTVVVSLAALLIIGGFVPQLISIFREKTCEGISRIFLFFDILGGVFSIVALSFHTPFDVISFLSYASVVVLDVVIWVLGEFVYGFGAARSVVGRRRGEGKEEAAGRDVEAGGSAVPEVVPTELASGGGGTGGGTGGGERKAT